MAFAAPLIGALAAGGGAAAAGTSLLTAVTIGSTALTALGAIQQGQYQSAVLRNNALVAEGNAARAAAAAAEEQKRSDIEYAGLLGEQYAAQGSSGLDIMSRSHRGSRALTRRVGRQAARDIYERGSTDAQNFLQDAANMRGEASAAKWQGYIGAAGSILDGAGKIMSQGSMVRRSNSGRRPWDNKASGSSKPNWYGG